MKTVFYLRVYEGDVLEIFVYSDESGVFDNVHNDIFVFAGVVFLGKEQKDAAMRKFLKAEKLLRENKYDSLLELKASSINFKDRGKLYRSLNSVQKVCTVIKQDKVNSSFFGDKKTKQRYLDYAYKMMIKRYLEYAIANRLFKKDDVTAIRFFVDEHSTATNGKYELKESIEHELRYGITNYEYNLFFPPLFDKNILKIIDIKFCDSKSVPLIRAADIVANRIFFNAKQDIDSAIKGETLYGIIQPN